MLLSAATLERHARAALEGVGDANLGEWIENREVVHVRRRLTFLEQLRVGNVRDIRGTEAAKRRLRAVSEYLPRGWTE